MARIKCPKCSTVNPDGQERCTQCNAALPRIRIDVRAGQGASEVTPAGGGEGAPKPAAAQLLPGQTVAGRYTVLALVGRGGMGCIYKVRDNTLGEEVVLKTLLPQFVRDKMVVERFFNEARIARRMAHPNIVRVHDIGSAQGMVYISMEFVQGKSLRNLMEELQAGRRLPPLRLLQCIEELCAALEYAHQFTVHRDIKPENIMVDRQGATKLMDFGISKLMANTRMTGASVVMGTPFYMSPEQLRNSRDVDARADIFSIGVVLYETLTGNVPTGVPKAPSDIVPDLPKSLDAVISKCVEPDPAKRYQNATELRLALAGIIEEMKLASQPATALGPARAERRAGGGLPWAGIAATLVCLAGTAGAVYWAGELPQAGPGAAAAAPASAASTVVDEFEAVESAMLRARDAATRLVVSSSQQGQDIFAAAEALYARMNDGTASDAAARTALAMSALQAYLAVLLQPGLPDMVFIPEGTARTEAGEERVPAFFADRYEVSQQQFAAFCRAAEWRQPCGAPTAEYASLPATMTTWYDAQAFAAHHGKRLPSSAQWLRAARGDTGDSRAYTWDGEYAADACNCESGEPMPVDTAARDLNWAGIAHLVGNVREWTRTPAGGDATPGFGLEMIVRGGDYESGPGGLEVYAPQPYAGYSEALGFRCVKELPSTLAEAEALLEQHAARQS
jgi:formylglycine-generating enzyme required for sulfatase activity/tRNA A-37 threonylcarbamoyl transferase component Bud32